MILYGVCCGSWEKLQRNVTPHTGSSPVLALSGQSSIADAYNAILWAAEVMKPDMLVLQHDDLEITDHQAVQKFLAVLEDPDVALVGVAGGRNIHGLDWWNAETVGHQQIDSGLLDFGPREGEVQSLEGSILVFSPWAMDNLTFDSRPGFHGYDEISMKALDAGKKVVVADVDTHHHTTLGFKSTESQEDWFRANEWFREKWKL